MAPKRKVVLKSAKKDPPAPPPPAAAPEVITSGEEDDDSPRPVFGDKRPPSAPLAAASPAKKARVGAGPEEVGGERDEWCVACLRRLDKVPDHLCRQQLGM